MALKIVCDYVIQIIDKHLNKNIINGKNGQVTN